MTNNVYIPSLEAADIWSHETRGSLLKMDYDGMIPQSMELERLRKLEKKEFTVFTSNRHPGKELSRDIVNVKFKQKLKSGAELLEILPTRIKEKEDEIKKVNSELSELVDSSKNRANITRLKKKLKSLNGSRDYAKRIIKQIESESNNDKKWESLSGDILRELLYRDGFTIKTFIKKTGEIIETKYKKYKRTGSKSRQGECLFIKEEIKNPMIEWSRMNLPFKQGEPVKLAELSAYEALVSSGIERMVQIEPANILITKDVISKFNETVNVVYKKENAEGKYERLVSEEKKNHPIENNIFDGEALLSSEYFGENESMLLLRHHMFKAAAFSTNLELFYRDHFGDEYETATVKDAFGVPMLVKDIKLVINYSCLKALKFSYLMEGENEEEQEYAMFEHWKAKVQEDADKWQIYFGVCKHEKEGKLGKTEKGIPLQQMSYQMFNSTGANGDQVKKLSKLTVEYIMKLKNNDETFIEYLKKEANDINANNMFVALYEKNKNIVRTKIFRDFRAKTISNYVKKIKSGKIFLEGDYLVLFGNGYEYLKHTLNQKITDESLLLKGNEVHMTLFEEKDNENEYTAFRNPHTAPSNILKIKTKYCPEIDTYFNLTKNVIMVNSWGFNLLNILSGSDFDSDSVAVYRHAELLKLADSCFGKYNVCVNEIKADPTIYHLTPSHESLLDNTLGKSQMTIGEVVNLGQLALSLYWDAKKHNKESKNLLEIVDIMTVLSGCAIDAAKRAYDINMNQEIKKIRGALTLKKFEHVIEKTGEIEYLPAKPNFWIYVYNDKYDKKQIKETNEEENKNQEEIDGKGEKEIEGNKIDKKGLITVHYDCPMDYLYDIKLTKANGKKNYSFGYLLNPCVKNKGNRRQSRNAKELAEELQDEISSIKSNLSISEEETDIKLGNVAKLYDETFNKMKINNNTMFDILRSIAESTDTGSKDERSKKNNSFVRLMNQLYKTQTEVFLNSFKNN